MPNPQALLYARHIEHRREEIDEILTELGYDGLLIHSGRPENRLFDDSHPPFRAHGPFVAMVPMPFAADSLLELRPGEKPRLWHCQPDDFWHMPPEPPGDWLTDTLDVEIVRSPDGWHEQFRQQRALAVIGDERAVGGLLDGADLNPPELMWRLDEMRTRKTAWERDCIERANHLAVSGHLAAAEAFRAGKSELEIHLAYLAAMGEDQDTLPYNSIVALNDHGAVLHYQFRSPERPNPVRSFLLDAGADWRGYAADITRTWTLDEHREFGDLIEAMDAAQRRLVDRVRAGERFVDLHREAHRAVAAVLEQAGIVRMAPEEQVETGVTTHFLPHGLGHYIGAQVHDVAGLKDERGMDVPPPERYPALRLTRTLEPGNVVTVEPGLYFIPSFLEKLRASDHASKVDWQAVERLTPFGGIRIEDNVLVSEGEPVNFTRQAFVEAG
ncbi:Xaa-Pro dipeptidase [Wenzhouxiangella sediminis]|uniref:Xaa-Pro dipeptidase n=1 Tax=Wenzhouxiangella sediminis TaxID=1792836 RepID=A0A3E1K514_9GAMM|nr:Xaa-Pro dipeptidase [Wenzhouxiangella sediminis]RFF29125.1 Xaa-Pro dipeptidase [Wenzhouxiangella sediminis]